MIAAGLGIVGPAFDDRAPEFAVVSVSHPGFIGCRWYSAIFELRSNGSSFHHSQGTVVLWAGETSLGLFLA